MHENIADRIPISDVLGATKRLDLTAMVEGKQRTLSIKQEIQNAASAIQTGISTSPPNKRLKLTD